MLNPYLKLNEKLFDEGVETAATRIGFGKGLVELGEKNPNVVALSADLTESTQVEAFAKAHPDRFIEIGVAEQNMAAVAAGLGVTGKITYISSYATFSPGKNWETLRTTAVYNQANVKIAGHHAGVMTGPDGATHQATEDIAITRCWPGITIFVPCDAVEARKATVASADIEGAVYLRFTRDKTPLITTDETPFTPSKSQLFWTSEKPEVTIISTGYMTYYALLAAKQLAEENIQTQVVNLATIKPLDKTGILEDVRRTRAVVTVEDHQVEGGMGSAVAELLAKELPTPMEFIGLQNTFAESGTPTELLTKYGLDTHAIKEAVKKVISRKGH